MELLPNLDKYLSHSEKDTLQNLNEEIALDYKKIGIAKANKDLCQGVINQYESGATSWPDNATLVYVDGTKDILGFPSGGRWYGKGEWRLGIFTDRDAFAKMEKDIQEQLDAKIELRDITINAYNERYKDQLGKDADASRGVAVTYATKMNEMNVTAYKYGVIAGIIIVGYIVYKKFKK